MLVVCAICRPRLWPGLRCPPMGAMPSVEHGQDHVFLLIHYGFGPEPEGFSPALSCSIVLQSHHNLFVLQVAVLHFHTYQFASAVSCRGSPTRVTLKHGLCMIMKVSNYIIGFIISSK